MDSKRKHILIAARRVFARTTYAQATISEIAKEADVARGSLHYYFKNKEDLFIHVMRSIYDESLGPTALKKIDVNGPIELANAIVEFLREAISSTPDFFRIIYESFSVTRQSSHVTEEMQKFWEGYRKETEDAVEELKGKGVIRSKASSVAIVTMIITLIHGFAIQMTGEKEIVDKEENWIALETAFVHLFDI